jgi:DNA-binding NtrC family response regulator
VASPRPVAAAAASFQDAKQRSIQEFEREYVLDLMNKHGGNITHAAREAGKDRRAFGRLVAKYRAQRCGGPAA